VTRSKFVLPLPRFVFHPVTTLAVAAVHVYLTSVHLIALAAGQVNWTNIWKGFGALLGAYVFAALASDACQSTYNMPLEQVGLQSSRIEFQFREGSSG
jgi:hypothetical protein